MCWEMVLGRGARERSHFVTLSLLSNHSLSLLSNGLRQEEFRDWPYCPRTPEGVGFSKSHKRKKNP
jgi:hypothetical protein